LARSKQAGCCQEQAKAVACHLRQRQHRHPGWGAEIAEATSRETEGLAQVASLIQETKAWLARDYKLRAKVIAVVVMQLQDQWVNIVEGDKVCKVLQHGHLQRKVVLVMQWDNV
jgi:putative protein kinase ArgK-like GTPase of G3E family